MRHPFHTFLLRAHQGCYAAAGLILAAFLADSLARRWTASNIAIALLSVFLLCVIGLFIEVAKTHSFPDEANRE